jgi:hypothetical protein
VVVTVNNANPVMVTNKKTLFIQKNDEIEVNHIESNYERGLSADILGYGTENDFRTRFKINQPTSIVIRKDKFYCGEISVQLAEDSRRSGLNAPSSEFHHLIFDVQGDTEVFDINSPIDIIKGETVKIIDAIPPLKNTPDIRVNVYGFVPKVKNERNDDINQPIDTALDLMSRYSQGGKGESYEIRLTSRGALIASALLRLVPPRLQSVTLISNGQSFKVKDGESIAFKENDKIMIESVQTNIPVNRGIKVNFRGFVGRNDAEDRNQSILLNHNLLREYSVKGAGLVYPITVSLKNIVFGTVYVKIEVPGKN